jgi:hypothetical protein
MMGVAEVARDVGGSHLREVIVQAGSVDLGRLSAQIDQSTIERFEAAFRALNALL